MEKTKKSNSEQLLIRVCKGQQTEMIPVWIMRQAGRYLPEYREIRKKADFLTLCKTPELVCEVTLQPVRIIGVDAAILFSDILIPIEAMGADLVFEPDGGPKFRSPVRSLTQVKKLRVSDPVQKTGFVMDAIRLTKKNLPPVIPLIGFSGAPFTLASYLVEGGSSASFRFIKGWMNAEPGGLHELLNKICDTIILYAKAQFESGADLFQIFDTWGGILSDSDYKAFSLSYIKKIIDELSRYKKPIILYVNNGYHLLDLIKESGADVISVDWRVPLNKIKSIVGKKAVLQGNMDPCALFGSKERIKNEVRKILLEGGLKGHIFNLGHGILPDTPVENAKYFVSCVHEESKKLIKENKKDKK